MSHKDLKQKEKLIETLDNNFWFLYDERRKITANFTKKQPIFSPLNSDIANRLIQPTKIMQFDTA